MPFNAVSGMLRMGTKHSWDILRNEAQDRLKAFFPSSFDDFSYRNDRFVQDVAADNHNLDNSKNDESDDDRENDDDEDEHHGGDDKFEDGGDHDDNKSHKSRNKNDEDGEGFGDFHYSIRMKVEDTFEVINLARTFNLPHLLPSAFYFIANMPLKVLMEGVRKHKLSIEDLTVCLEGAEDLKQAEVCALKTLLLHQKSPQCEKRRACRKAYSAAISKLITDTQIWQPGALRMNTGWLREDLGGVCDACCQHICVAYQAEKQQIWDSLGKYFGVSPWPPS